MTCLKLRLGDDLCLLSLFFFDRFFSPSLGRRGGAVTDGIL